MIVLDGATGAIEIVLAGAVTTTALPVTAHWVDVLSSDQSVSAIGHSDGAATGTGTLSVVTGPSVGHTRTIKYLSVYNADSTGATVTVRYNNGTTTRILVKPLLAVGSTLEYSADD